MYDAGFYDTIRAGCQSSAAVVVPLVVELFTPRTVIDVGCGEGWWASAFAEIGCEVTGMDYPNETTMRALGGRFLAIDLAHASFGMLARADLAVALEVAEHLPERRADSFVDDLCTVAPVVLFSAAIPGQGGTGHINEQWPDYWAAMFARRGYAVSGALRWLIWSDDRVENWYRQNLLIAARDPQIAPSMFEGPLAEPHRVVHPILYDARRH
jgi:SAM-dependent methyltransferase